MILLRLTAFVLPYRQLLVGSILLMLAASVVGLAGPDLVRRAVDGPITEGVTAAASGEELPAGVLTGLSWILGIYLGLVLLEFALSYFQAYVTTLTGQRVMYSLRQKLFGHLQLLELGFYDRNPVGALVTRVTSDIESLTEMFTSGVAAIFNNLAKAIFILVVLFFFNTKLALMTVAFLPPLIIGTWLFARAARLAFRRMRSALSHANAFLQEATSGVRVTQLFGAEREMQQEFDRRNETLREAHMGTVWVYSLMFPFVTVLTALGVAGILYLGAAEVAGQRLTSGELLQFYLYLMLFFEPVRELSERWNVLQSAAASAERIFGILDREPGVVDPEEAEPLPRLAGELEFDAVTFGYNADEPVLRDLSFHVRAGERVAIVGATGAGKTTIISLLSRFYDVQEGAIRIDGRDVREMHQRQLRRQIAVVLQDVFLFAGTVRENITLHESSITDEQIHEAARAVHADSFLARLPNGLDSRVSERGTNLSAGERQLLAFTRAFVTNPAILVLDEATANIDSQTEALIQSGLHRLMEGRTSVVIAHRLSTIRDCDRILVLHKGELREEGNHDQLLAAGGIYSKLYQLQFGIPGADGA